MDSTPRPGNLEPDRPDQAPPWFLVTMIVAIVLVFVWLLWSTFGSGSF